MSGVKGDALTALSLPVVASDQIPIIRGTQTYRTPRPFNPQVRVPTLVHPSTADFAAWSNQGSAIVTDLDGSMRIQDGPNAFTALRMRERSLPAGTSWTVTLGCLRGQFRYQYFSGGLHLRESATGKIETLGWYMDGPLIANTKWNSNSNVSAHRGDTVTFDIPVVLWFRAIRAGSVLTYQVSFDGLSWGTISSTSVTTINDFFTTAPDKWGLYLNPLRSGGTGPDIIAMEAFHWSETT